MSFHGFSYHDRTTECIRYGLKWKQTEVEKNFVENSFDSSYLSSLLSVYWLKAIVEGLGKEVHIALLVGEPVQSCSLASDKLTAKPCLCRVKTKLGAGQ